MRRRLTREESRERTREELLDAAAVVFGRVGYAAASVEEVAETAGYSKGAVYSNYASKADLFLALLDREYQRVGPEWDEVFSPEKTMAERVAGVERMIHTEGPDCAETMLHMEFFLYAMRDPEARAKLAERYRAMRSGMATVLGRHFEQIESRPPIPLEQLVWVLAASEMGLQIQACIDPEAVPEGIWAASQFPILGEHADD